MTSLLIAIGSQTLLFLPLAFGISISFNLLRATDMTIDGSFVLGAAVTAKLMSLSFSPCLATIFGILSGSGAGLLTALIQRHDRVDALLAGILATFMLTSINLSIMGKPNISLLANDTLFSSVFNAHELLGWGLVMVSSFGLCALVFFILKSRLGLILRAFGDNPELFKRLGRQKEWYRCVGFSLTNLLAAGAGSITAQTIGYADVGMGFGVTLTGIGSIIIGQQLFYRLKKFSYVRLSGEFFACLIGVSFYFSLLNVLLRFSVDPIYLKLCLGTIIILFLRAANYQHR